MKALKATVTILLDPRVIGPDAQTEWTNPASAADWASAVLSEVNEDTVLDWGYEGKLDPETQMHWSIVEVDPDTYEEGDIYGYG